MDNEQKDSAEGLAKIQLGKRSSTQEENKVREIGTQDKGSKSKLSIEQQIPKRQNTGNAVMRSNRLFSNMLGHLNKAKSSFENTKHQVSL